MKRKLLALLLVFAVFFAVPCTSAVAAVPVPDAGIETQPIQPRWSYLNYSAVSLRNHNGDAACSYQLRVRTDMTVTIDALIKLIQIDAEGNETVTNTWTATTLQWTDTVPADEGCKYVLSITLTLKGSDGGQEIIPLGKTTQF